MNDLEGTDIGGVAPKTDENDPPAADRPVAESPGSPAPKSPEPADDAGRRANDPSVQQQGLVPEALQCPPGKPDGEVDTSKRGSHTSAASEVFSRRR